METRGNLISYIPELKVLDATIRDGGLVNSFFFTDEFVSELYKANIAAGVDYMEFGYKASKDIFSPSDFGKWKFCEEDDLRAIVGDNDSPLKISVMADVGRTNYKRDIIEKSESAIDMVRVATYINTIPAAIEIAEYCKNKGYETTVNIMAVATANDEDIETALDLLGKSNIDGIYLVDSYGSLYPEQIARLCESYVEVAEKTGKYVGIHSHNNQQLAFANTIEALRLGVNYLDATVSGMGRGAGNCASELLLGFLNNPKYQLLPIIKFIEKYMLKIREEGAVWGYDIPYLLTGVLNQHPSSAIKMIKSKDTNYVDFYHELLD